MRVAGGPDDLDAMLDFFDHDAHLGRPAFASCYRVYHHVPGHRGDRAWRQNRDELARRVGEGTTTGILALVDERLAAWWNASLRSEFPELRGRRVLRTRRGCGPEARSRLLAVTLSRERPPYPLDDTIRVLLEMLRRDAQDVPAHRFDLVPARPLLVELPPAVW